MAVGNVEYKFPIVQEKNHTILQGAFFYDIGGTWASASDVDLSIGTEINNSSPVSFRDKIYYSSVPVEA